LNQYEENLQDNKQVKNPRNGTASLQVTGPQSIPSYVPSILHVFLLGLGSQIEIFGEAPPNLKKRAKNSNKSLV
jgi:hypothetical protein